MKQKIELDDLIRSAVKKEGLQSPDADFTDRVMASLPPFAQQAKGYHPLISGKMIAGAISIFACILAILLWMPVSANGNVLNMGFVQKIATQLGQSFYFRLSENLLYIFVCAFLMLAMQLIIIGRRIRKMI